MFLSLYEANKWIEPLDDYLNDPKLTDKAWFNLEDIIPLWRAADSVKGKLYGLPTEGEATIHVFNREFYEKKGLKPPATMDEFKETAKQLNKIDGKAAGAALRGFRGAGQNMYIWPSLFLMWGGKWFDADGKPLVNSEPGVKSLEYYCDLLQNYGPAGVENWNWPEIMEAYAGGNVRAVHRCQLDRLGHREPGQVQGRRQDRLPALAQGTFRPPGDEHLELGHVDQLGPFQEEEGGDLALHPVADLAAHAAVLGPFQGVGRRGRAHRGQPDLHLDRPDLSQGDRLHAGLRRCGADHDEGGHRPGLAAARAAVAEDRRGHGGGHPGRPWSSRTPPRRRWTRPTPKSKRS